MKVMRNYGMKWTYDRTLWYTYDFLESSYTNDYYLSVAIILRKNTLYTAF